MEQLAREFSGIASFFTVWCREAHPGGAYPQADDVATRARYARDFVAAASAAIPVVLDDAAGTLQAALGGFPNSVYVIDRRGRVTYRANWTDAREVRRVLERLRLVGERLRQGEPLGMPRWSEELTPVLYDEPDQEAVASITTWEEARNFDEPERFLGPERAAALRAAYARATGRESIRPESAPGS